MGLGLAFTVVLPLTTADARQSNDSVRTTIAIKPGSVADAVAWTAACFAGTLVVLQV